MGLVPPLVFCLSWACGSLGCCAFGLWPWVSPWTPGKCRRCLTAQIWFGFSCDAALLPREDVLPRWAVGAWVSPMVPKSGNTVIGAKGRLCCMHRSTAVSRSAQGCAYSRYPDVLVRIRFRETHTEYSLEDIASSFFGKAAIETAIPRTQLSTSATRLSRRLGRLWSFPDYCKRNFPHARPLGLI